MNAEESEHMHKIESLIGCDGEWCEDVDCDKFEQGVELLLQAAEKGILEAQYRYGRLCMFDDGYDICDATKWLRKAADSGCMAAADLLARFYIDPNYTDGIDEDEPDKLCFDYALKAARAGYVYSQCKLCYMYATGLGVPVDIEAAMHWLNVSCNSPYTPTRFARNVKRSMLDGMSLYDSVMEHCGDLICVDGHEQFVNAMAFDCANGGCNSCDPQRRVVLCRKGCYGAICGLAHCTLT